MPPQLADERAQRHDINELFARRKVGGLLILSRGIAALPDHDKAGLISFVLALCDYRHYDDHGDSYFWYRRLKGGVLFHTGWFNKTLTAPAAEYARRSKKVRVIWCWLPSEG